MIKCPYCQGEMRKGFIKTRGGHGIRWIEENEEKNAIQNAIHDLMCEFRDSNCIVLDSEKNFAFQKNQVMANYCEHCKKIIIDVDDKSIRP